MERVKYPLSSAALAVALKHYKKWLVIKDSSIALHLRLLWSCFIFNNVVWRQLAGNIQTASCPIRWQTVWDSGLSKKRFEIII